MQTVGRTPRARLVARLVLYGGFVLVGLPAAFSHVLVAPHRLDTGPAPPGFRDMPLVSDGLTLRAWAADGAPGRSAVILAHGLGDSMDSYAEVAARLHRRGHPVMMADLRGHGRSEGRHTTMGGLESHDVRALMSAARSRGVAAQGLVLMGWSMGAVAVLHAAADQPDVKAVIAEAPYDSYRDTVAHHGQLLYGIPRWFPLGAMAIAVAEWRAGFDADDVDSMAAARRIKAPLLTIVDGNDPRMPEAVVRRIYDAHPGPKELWVAPGVEHTGAMLRPEYDARVIGFLEKHGL